MDDDDVKKIPGKQFLGFCAVCGDKANGSRDGAPACLGCIVFFRRAVCKQAEYRCPKAQKCEITFGKSLLFLLPVCLPILDGPSSRRFSSFYPFTISLSFSTTSQFPSPSSSNSACLLRSPVSGHPRLQVHRGRLHPPDVLFVERNERAVAAAAWTTERCSLIFDVFCRGDVVRLPY